LREADLSRFFTLEEANAALELVRPLAERMAALRKRLSVDQRRQAELVMLVGGNGHGNSAREYAEVSQRLEEDTREMVACAGEIQGLGAIVKDLELGLVDFPSLRAGEEVLLCWRVGEDEIHFWHPVGEGFSGRRPL
jgi:hypothetical protein